MPRYIITERAGRFVAGHTNTGVGTALVLTERAAAHEVRLGTLIPETVASEAAPKPAQKIEPVAPVATAPEPVEASDPAERSAEEVVAPKPRRRKAKAE